MATGVAWSARGDGEQLWFLGTLAPAGLEAMVRDGSVPAAAPSLPLPDAPRPSPEKLAQLFERHGQVNVGPPLGPDD